MTGAIDLDGYLRRIGYDGARQSTLAVLRGVQYRHALSITFENLDPLLRRPVPLDLPSLERKIVHDRRGGYCFEHNLLFRHALDALGFRVAGLAGRVLWNVPEGAELPRTHMLLRVQIDGESHIADVGFGGQTLTGPLRLHAGSEQATPHEPYRLIEAGGGFMVQSLTGDSWRSLYRFDPQEQRPADYEMANWYVSTHPQSRFLNNLIVALPAPDRRHALFNREFAVHHLGGPTERRLLADARGDPNRSRGRFRPAAPGRSRVGRGAGSAARFRSPLGVNLAPCSDNRRCRPVGVLLGGRPGDDREAHDPMPLPLCAAGEADAVSLDALDHPPGQVVTALDRLIGAETDRHLVQDHVVFDADPGLRGQPVSHPPRQPAMARHHRRDAGPAECPDQRPGGEAAGAPRQLRHEISGVALALGDRRQIARGDRHGAAMGLGIAHDGIAAVVRGLQPLVAVGGPGIGVPCPGGERPGLGAGERPQAESAVDVDPCAASVGDRRDLADRIEGPGIDLPGLGDDDRRSRHPFRSPP